jgi:sialic acid synthase SpsE
MEIGDGFPTRLIAEIGLNHNGDEELAKKLITAAAESGAELVKFQKRSPSDLATAAFLDAPFAKCPEFGSTQREVREKLELSKDAHVRLKAHAESLGLVFFSAAFDIPSLKFLQDVGVGIIKIPSHSITNGPLLKEIAASKLPVVASLGAATESERDQAIEILKQSPLVLLHCVSSYPTADELVYLDTITYYRDRYGVPIGFSSHEVGIDISVAASVLGACMIERHFTFDKTMVGLDHKISLEPAEFLDMANRIKRLAVTRGAKTELKDAEKNARNSYHVAVCARESQKSGTVLTADMLVCKQPLTDSEKFFTGLEFESVVGKVLKQDVEGDTAIPRDALA